jgi:hypothetical protein
VKALQRNFESISALCMKAENDKAGLKKIVEQQTNEISDQA